MARETTRVARGQRGVDANGDPQLGFDEALVGTGDDGAAQIDIDPSERDNNPFLGSEQDDENWDLPEDKRRKQTGGQSQTGGTTRQAREHEQRDEEGDGEEDLRLAYDEPEEEQRTSRRSRRNRSRRQAIDQRDQHIAFLTNEIQQLREAQANLHGGQFDLSARDVESRIQNHQAAIERADVEIARAIKDSDGDTAVALQRERDRLNYQLWQLQNTRQNMVEYAERMQRGGQPDGRPQLDPRQVAQLQAQDGEFQRMKDVFLDRYSWFDEANDDPDHQFVKQLDRKLYEEGFQRHQKAFWHEMERRMMSAGFRPDNGAEFNDDEEPGFQSRRQFQSRRVNGNGHYNGGQPRRANLPPTGMVRSTSRPGRGDGGFALSDEQVDLLRQEGLLDNNLSEADQAKKDRIVGKWRRGAQALQSARR